MNPIAAILLESGAVNIRPHDPFTLTSGKKSPVYVDCRRLISFVDARRRIIALMKEKMAPLGFDAIAGGETAGIPYAAWLAEALDLPMLYVRKKPKGFGRNAQIEGTFPEGAKVLLVEDLAMDGGSKAVFVHALRAAGALVEHTIVVFSYGLASGSHSPLAALGVELHSLATWADILAYAEASGQLTADQIADVRRFLANPAGWEG